LIRNDGARLIEMGPLLL